MRTFSQERSFSHASTFSKNKNKNFFLVVLSIDQVLLSQTGPEAGGTGRFLILVV